MPCIKGRGFCQGTTVCHNLFMTLDRSMEERQIRISHDTCCLPINVAVAYCNIVGSSKCWSSPGKTFLIRPIRTTVLFSTCVQARIRCVVTRGGAHCSWLSEKGRRSRCWWQVVVVCDNDSSGSYFFLVRPSPYAYDKQSHVRLLRCASRFFLRRVSSASAIGSRSAPKWSWLMMLRR